MAPNLIKKFKNVFNPLLLLSVVLSFSAEATDVSKNSGEITVSPKADVVVETLTFLMPNTTKRAMQMAGKLVIPENDLHIIEQLKDMAPKSSEFKHLKFEGGVYSPYLDSDSPAYKTTAIYKMFHTIENESDLSLLPIMRHFNFETVLGAFNYVLIIASGGIIALAIAKMSWVSMTVEDNSKAWKKLIISTPAILIALILIRPMEDLGGVSLAQLLMVFAVVVSNYFAANFALVASSALFSHIVKTTENSDNQNITYARLADEDTKKIISQVVVLANQKLLAEQSIGKKIFSLTEGKSLTNETLRAGISKFNIDNKLVGTEFELKATCFGSDWGEQFANDAGCKFFLQRAGEGHISMRSKDQINFNGSITHINNLIPDIEANGELKFNEESYWSEVQKVIPNMEKAFDEIYRFQKQSFCANKARRGSYPDVVGWSFDSFDSSFVCKSRDSSDGFGLVGVFYGVSGAKGSKMLPMEPSLDIQSIYNNINESLKTASKSQRIEQVSFASSDYTFYHRGFFISPIEAVMTAVGYILRFENEFFEMKSSLASDFSKRVAIDSISSISPVNLPLDKASKESLGRDLSESQDLVSRINSVVYSDDSLGWFNVLWNIDDLIVPKDGGESVSVSMKNVRLRTIEPYSYMQMMYSSLLPISGATLIIASSIKIFIGHGMEYNTSTLIFMKTMFTVGGILFLSAILAKLLAGAFFLWSAISLLFLSIKRFIIYLIASPLMAIKFLKDQFHETEDDEDNVTVSRYVLGAMFRLSIDLSMIFVALMAAFIIGTIASNLAAYMVILYGSTITEISSKGASDILTTIIVIVSINFALMWGMYRGVKMINYTYDKTTDFVDDVTGVKAEDAHQELLGFVKTAILPTYYLK
ncbi:hypothetical protein QTV49_001697 [Vibrio vulnificus]|nr:hypothetical protein [Vibrio vulnificus]